MQTDEQIQVVRQLVEGYYKNSLSDPTLSLPPIETDEGQFIISIGTSILGTKWGIGYPGGSFVQAVLQNNLMAAVNKADSINIKVLPFYCKLIYNVGMPTELAYQL
jgi:hypothetical protein